jgi:hypothetical protein
MEVSQVADNSKRERPTEANPADRAEGAVASDGQSARRRRICLDGKSR